MNTNTNRIVVSLLAGLVSISCAQADIQRRHVPNTIAGALTYDFYATASANIAAVEMLLTSPSGIYQDTVGTNSPPNQAFFDIFPTLEFDTYVGLGSTVAGGSAGEPQFAGGAVDIGGAPAVTFDESLLDVAWFPSGGFALPGDVPQFVARVTLMDDADVVLFIQSSDGATENLQFRLFVPEPSGIALFCIGILGFMRRG